MAAELRRESGPQVRLTSAAIIEGRTVYRVEVPHNHRVFGDSSCQKIIRFQFPVTAIDFFPAQCECGEDIQVDPLGVKMEHPTLFQNSIAERKRNRPRRLKLKSRAV